MSWTVPSGCYYGYHSWSTRNPVTVYYSSGKTVPTEYAPNQPFSSDFGAFFLADYNNGVIYSTSGGLGVEFDNANRKFTFTSFDRTAFAYAVHIVCSNYALDKVCTHTGDNFVFGASPTIMAKFTDSTFSAYSALWAFRGRTDLTNAPTIPSGVSSMRSCFYGCTSLTTAPTIPSSVTDMSYCFYNCASLTTAPIIPNSVTLLVYCFYGCTALTTAPTIPSSVTNMKSCFRECTSLTTAPTIPSNVTDISYCFADSMALAGAVTINATPSNFSGVFGDITNEIVLFGSGSNLETIASLGNNIYVWSLSQTMTAVRDERTSTTVNISVDVSWFKTGNLTSLVLSKDGTAQAVTWNDPTLEITSSPTTFTATLANISDSATPTLTVIATDQYGSATAVSVKIPIAFYTMDVQAGGKEIAFGAIATDNLTSHPNGLFKCNMDTSFNDMTQQEVDDFIDNLNVRGGTVGDFVAEQGTSGIWTYRKWNSGIAECWGVTGMISLTHYATYGGFHAYYTIITFPQGLFVESPCMTYSAYNNSGFALTGTINTISASQANLYALCSTSGTHDTQWRITAKGRWK